MATTTLKVLLKQATKTESEWALSNPVIPDGVVAYSSDTGLYKLGDGISKWSELENMDSRYAKLLDVDKHIKDTTAHTTATDKSHLSSAYNHSQSSHAPENAEQNTIEGIQKNGADLVPNSSRKVNITVPQKVSELDNDSKLTSVQIVRWE